MITRRTIYSQSLITLCSVSTTTTTTMEQGKNVMRKKSKRKKYMSKKKTKSRESVISRIFLEMRRYNFIQRGTSEELVGRDGQVGKSNIGQSMDSKQGSKLFNSHPSNEFSCCLFPYLGKLLLFSPMNIMDLPVFQFESSCPQMGMPPQDSPMPPQRNPPQLLEHMMDVVPTPTQPSNPRSQADSKFSFSIARVAASKHSIRMRSFPPNAWVFSEKIRKPFISKKEEVGTRGSPPSLSCCCYYSGAKGKKKGRGFLLPDQFYGCLTISLFLLWSCEQTGNF